MRNKSSITAGSLYDTLKRKAEAEQEQERSSKPDESTGNADKPLALDDTERIKVLSPGRLVVKRFFRNKLAMIGLTILVFMFLFAFTATIVYPYSQTEIFYKYDYLSINYASATERTENIVYAIPGGPKVKVTIENRFNSYISELEAEGVTEKTVTATDGAEYIISKLGDRVYTLSTKLIVPVGEYYSSPQVAIYDRILKSFDWVSDSLPDEINETLLSEVVKGAGEFEFNGTGYTITATKTKCTVTRLAPEFSGTVPSEGFIAALENNLSEEAFEFNGKLYSIAESGEGSFSISETGGISPALIASTYVFNSFDISTPLSNEFKINALFAIHGLGMFTADGASYSLVSKGDSLFITDATGSEVADLSVYSVRRYSGQDTLSIDFKETVVNTIKKMEHDYATTASFVYGIQEIDASGKYLYNDDGTPRLSDSEITLNRKHTGEYVLTCKQITYLIDIYSPPTGEHLLGTDGDGMDILARMMYGGRVSLLVGFVVVILEIVLGIVMGGISGFFSGWIDTLIMRITDVFLCIPDIPILIIIGALFDKMKMDPYQRLIWMMFMLGMLGWASVARLVRGQILSFREQEFMIAQEATGMKARQRIFRHLVPNVMPQLIVTATMGIGNVILYESTLSFLGLGVKHPLATWGTMINAVTSTVESMKKYTYIWIPVGLLICLTVIAFNFVGDGLRDAFDPKMKR